MKIFQGTRLPFLAAACAMVIIGAGSADGTGSGLSYILTFVSPPVGGIDGCPALAGSTFDPRELCAADIGKDWTPVDVRVLPVCSRAFVAGATLLDKATEVRTFVAGATLVNKATEVDEYIVTEPDSASALTYVRARVSCILNSALPQATRKLPAVAIPGVAAETQLRSYFPGGGGGISTYVVLGNVVISIDVSGDGQPNNATALRIVNTAIHRFQNPRPYGGPFAPVASPAPAPASP
jgi:hypothetical protein